MGRNFVLDATVVLHDPRAVLSFEDTHVVIPIEVVEETDRFRRDMDERGRNSRAFARVLDGLRPLGRLGEGVELDRGSSLRIACEPVGCDLAGLDAGGAGSVDNRVLMLALYLQRRDPDAETAVVTRNVSLRVKADALGVRTLDYEKDPAPEADVYAGWLRVSAPGEAVAAVSEGVEVTLPDLSGRPNEYVLLQDEDNQSRTALGRLSPEATDHVLPLAHKGEDAAGIRPLNLEQTFALDALLEDDIKLVTLTGKAGTGKTLLAVAAGLRKIFLEDCYNRLLVFRPTMAVGRDMGYLPGDLNDKMQPWMQPIRDALELIREIDRRNSTRSFPPDILDCEEIVIQPLSYIRGRSIPHQYLVIDEAQNLTPLEIKTAITRVGLGTKVVVTGDPHQIDNPRVDSLSNGLTTLVRHFRGSELSAHIGLWKGERSPLAEAAADLL